MARRGGPDALAHRKITRRVPTKRRNACRRAFLPTQPPSTRRVHSIFCRRIQTYGTNDRPAAAYASAAFDLASKSGDRVGQAEADLNNALNAINQGKLDDMVAVTHHSVTVLEGRGPPGFIGRTCCRTTLIYRQFDQVDESGQRSTVRAMDIANRSNNPLALAYAHQGWPRRSNSATGLPIARAQSADTPPGSGAVRGCWRASRWAGWRV